VELYHHFPNTPSWRGAQLKKRHRDTFYLYPLDRRLGGPQSRSGGGDDKKFLPYQEIVEQI